MLESSLQCINSRGIKSRELIIASARQHHALIKDNLQESKIFLISNMIKKGKTTLLQRFSIDSFLEDFNCLHAMSQNCALTHSFVHWKLSFICAQLRFL